MPEPQRVRPQPSARQISEVRSSKKPPPRSGDGSIGFNRTAALLRQSVVSKHGVVGIQPALNPLPNNYKQTYRKVIMAMVAAPIAIVTSYVLYQRLILGHEKKRLIPSSDNPRSTPGPKQTTEEA